MLNRLAANHFDAALLNPIQQVCPELAGCIDRDSLLRSQFQTNLGAALHLLDISLMRAVPEPFKNAVFNQGNFQLSPSFSPSTLSGDALVVWDDSRVLGLYAAQVQAVDETPHAVFLHLMNTHPPYILDSDCRLVTVEDHDPGSRKSAVQQATCAIAQFAVLLQSLESQDAYDQSVIVLLGDHGSSSAYADKSLASQRLSGEAPLPEGATRLVGSANPLLMIKPLGAKWGFQHDLRPAALTDVPATVCAALGVCDWSTGEPLAAEVRQTDREREFLSYRWENQLWQLGYIPDLDYYSITGPVSDWSSWHLKDGVRSQAVLALEFAETDDPAIFGDGWGDLERSPPGDYVRWVLGRDAELNLDLEADKNPGSTYRLNFTLWVPEFNPGQSVRVNFNGRALPQHALPPGMQTVNYRIPADAVVPGLNQVRFTFETAGRPNDKDLRELAVVFTSLSLEKMELDN
ncbi:MAG: hypothetical protein ACREO9_02825 [Lysobacterales bacterium]